MSATRDHDELFRAFLDEGPEVLPDRVLAAIADDVHRRRQRAPLRPWRFTTMRTYVAAAAVVLIVAAGAGLYLASRAAPPPGHDPTTTPRALPTGEARLESGVVYDSGAFSQPLTFTVPGDAPTTVRSDLWADAHTLRLRPLTGGAITLHDEEALPNDLCHPTGTINDAPQDVGAWLAASNGLTVSEPGQLSASGPGPRFWDVVMGPDCYVGDGPPGGPSVYFQAGEHHRIYAVPVGTDTVLVFTWGRGYQGEGDEVLESLNSYTDQLVSSIQATAGE